MEEPMAGSLYRDIGMGILWRPWAYHSLLVLFRYTTTACLLTVPTYAILGGKESIISDGPAFTLLVYVPLRFSHYRLKSIANITCEQKCQREEARPDPRPVPL